MFRVGQCQIALPLLAPFVNTFHYQVVCLYAVLLHSGTVAANFTARKYVLYVEFTLLIQQLFAIWLL